MVSEAKFWATQDIESIKAAAIHAFGQPSTQLSNDIELRFGSKGSIKVTLKGRWRGRWNNFEHDKKGWLPVDGSEHKDFNGSGKPTGAAGSNGANANGEWNEAKGQKTKVKNKKTAGESAEDHVSKDDDAAEEQAAKLAHNLAQWNEAGPLKGTLGEQYLVETRHLPAPIINEPTLGWHPAHCLTPDAPPQPAILAQVVSLSTGEMVALHAIRLDPKTGNKIANGPAKVSYGPVSDGVIRLGDPTSQTIAVAEGLETGASRLAVAPCDLRICCGPVRFTPPEKHQTRAEILVDTGAEKNARKAARNYDSEDLRAYLVSAPKVLGAKADLNDLLQNDGLEAVSQAVSEAERVEAVSGDRSMSGLRLKRGSDVHIAQRILETLEDIYGRVQITDGRVWRFDGRIWGPLFDDVLKYMIHGADGETFPTPSGGIGQVKLSRNTVASIEDSMLPYRRNDDFFLEAPVGIPCDNGFICFDPTTGEHALKAHDRNQRQRHLLAGRYREITKEEFDQSLLMKLIAGAFRDDDDAGDKVRLIEELAGCVALGYGTRLPSPKAVVLYGESGANGKSAVQDTLRGLTNPEAVCAIPPAKFGDEKYAIQLAGKVLNAADELGDQAIQKDSFKSVVTGELVPGRDLYQSATSVRPVALHVFSTNTLPGFSRGIDGGVLRRLLPVAFEAVIPEAERIPKLGRRICEEEPDLLLHFAVAGAARLLKQGAFTVPASSQKLLDQWVSEVDPVRAWAKERLEITEEPADLSASEAYEDFVKWNIARGTGPKFIPQAHIFGRRLKAAVPELKGKKVSITKYTNARLRAGNGGSW